MTTEATHMPQSFSITSDGTTCDAWYFPASNDDLTTPAGRPAVVMAHGFAGTKDCGLDSFGSRLADAGLDVVAFDYRGFGASEGEPRQIISPPAQIADYRAALAATAALPGVDPDRLVLWGVSMSGGTVLDVAAGRADVAAVISLTPLVTALANEKPPAHREGAPGDANRTAGSTASLLALAARDKLAARTGRRRVMAPVVGQPGETALINFPGTYDDYVSIAGPTWRNEVNASIALDALANRPNRAAGKVTCPALFQIADHDRCVPVHAAVKAGVKAGALIRHYPCDHFDVYPGKRWHQHIIDHQVAFLTKVLRPQVPAPL
ncbi:pimeloyl-ACP methyl ester carboxylesterase [Gordonia amarae]|nr:alpha/beta hydrolase [Gordonia amarae]MCS3877801.1 pimeloyl-ACP methyl ester carboxylesterase [Gordonia amarae]